MAPVRRFRIALLVLLVVVGVCGLAFAKTTLQVVRAYVQSGASMEPTLMVGDYFLVRPLVGQALPRGEVVQMVYPLDPSQVWIKRIVAVGGDRVRFRDKALILNGAAVTEPYAVHRSTYIDPFRDNFPMPPNFPLPGNWTEYLQANTVNGEVVVPPGKYFVLGDNRDDSLDSRYFGFVDRAYIIGTPILIYFSKPSGNGSIRWDRMFRKF